MSIELMKGRLLVLLDDGEDDRGVIFQSNLGGYSGLVVPRELPEDPEDPIPPIEQYNHIIFVKEMATEIEVDGVAYQAIHRDAIVAVITD